MPSDPKTADARVPYRRRFLALTQKYGWIVVEPATSGWTGYWTVPGKYGLSEEMIRDRAPLPIKGDCHQ